MKDHTQLFSKIESNSNKLSIAGLVKKNEISVVSAVSTLLFGESHLAANTAATDADIKIADALLENRTPSIKSIEREILDANILDQSEERSRIYSFRSLLSGKSSSEALVYASLQLQKSRERKDKLNFRLKLMAELDELKSQLNLPLIGVNPSKAKIVDLLISNYDASETLTFVQKSGKLSQVELTNFIWAIHSNDLKSDDHIAHGVRYVFRKLFKSYAPDSLKIETKFHEEPMLNNVSVSVNDRSLTFSLPKGSSFIDIYAKRESILRTLLFVLNVEAEARGYQDLNSWKFMSQNKMEQQQDKKRRSRHHGIEPNFLDSFIHESVKIPVEELYEVNTYADNIRNCGYALSNKLYQIKDCYLSHILKSGRGSVVGIVKRENSELLKSIEFIEPCDVVDNLIKYLDGCKNKNDVKNRVLEVIKKAYIGPEKASFSDKQGLSFLSQSEYKQSIGQSIIDHYSNSNEESALFSVAKDIGGVHAAKALFFTSDEESGLFRNIRTFDHIRRRSISSYFDLAVIQVQNKTFVIPTYKVQRFIKEEAVKNVMTIKTRNKVADEEYSTDKLKRLLLELRVDLDLIDLNS